MSKWHRRAVALDRGEKCHHLPVGEREEAHKCAGLGIRAHEGVVRYKTRQEFANAEGVWVGRGDRQRGHWRRLPPGPSTLGRFRRLGRGRGTNRHLCTVGRDGVGRGEGGGGAQTNGGRTRGLLEGWVEKKHEILILASFALETRMAEQGQNESLLGNPKRFVLKDDLQRRRRVVGLAVLFLLRFSLRGG